MKTNPNTKNNYKKQYSYEQMTPPVEEFGLGIQVFKIQSNKVVEGDRQNQRKMIKNIENPNFVKPATFVIKKPNVLPSLSTEKKSKFIANSASSKERRTTIEKNKQAYMPDTIKQEHEKEKIKKKYVSTHHILKNQNSTQEPAVEKIKEKEKIQVLYTRQLNEMRNFYEKMEEMQANNFKEIKRLKKLKENQQNQEQLAHEIVLRENKSQMVKSLVESEPISAFDGEIEYDEFDLTIYSEAGQKFTYYDVEERNQY